MTAFKDGVVVCDAIQPLNFNENVQLDEHCVELPDSTRVNSFAMEHLPVFHGLLHPENPYVGYFKHAPRTVGSFSNRVLAGEFVTPADALAARQQRHNVHVGTFHTGPGMWSDLHSRFRHSSGLTSDEKLPRRPRSGSAANANVDVETPKALRRSNHSVVTISHSATAAVPLSALGALVEAARIAAADGSAPTVSTRTTTIGWTRPASTLEQHGIRSVANSSIDHESMIQSSDSMGVRSSFSVSGTHSSLKSLRPLKRDVVTLGRGIAARKTDSVSLAAMSGAGKSVPVNAYAVRKLPPWAVAAAAGGQPVVVAGGGADELDALVWRATATPTSGEVQRSRRTMPSLERPRRSVGSLSAADDVAIVAAVESHWSTSATHSFGESARTSTLPGRRYPGAPDVRDSAPSTFTSPAPSYISASSLPSIVSFGRTILPIRQARTLPDSGTNNAIVSASNATGASTPTTGAIATTNAAVSPPSRSVALPQGWPSDWGISWWDQAVATGRDAGIGGAVAADNASGATGATAAPGIALTPVQGEAVHVQDVIDTDRSVEVLPRAMASSRIAPDTEHVRQQAAAMKPTATPRVVQLPAARAPFERPASTSWTVAATSPVDDLLLAASGSGAEDDDVDADDNEAPIVFYSPRPETPTPGLGTGVSARIIQQQKQLRAETPPLPQRTVAAAWRAGLGGRRELETSSTKSPSSPAKAHGSHLRLSPQPEASSTVHDGVQSAASTALHPSTSLPRCPPLAKATGYASLLRLTVASPAESPGTATPEASPTGGGAAFLLTVREATHPTTMSAANVVALEPQLDMPSGPALATSSAPVVMQTSVKPETVARAPPKAASSVEYRRPPVRAFPLIQWPAGTFGSTADDITPRDTSARNAGVGATGAPRRRPEDAVATSVCEALQLTQPPQPAIATLPPVTYLLGASLRVKHSPITDDYALDDVVGDGGYALVRRAWRHVAGPGALDVAAQAKDGSSGGSTFVNTSTDTPSRKPSYNGAAPTPMAAGASAVGVYVVKCIRKRYLASDEERHAVTREVEIHRMVSVLASAAAVPPHEMSLSTAMLRSPQHDMVTAGEPLAILSPNAQQINPPFRLDSSDSLGKVGVTSPFASAGGITSGVSLTKAQRSQAHSSLLDDSSISLSRALSINVPSLHETPSTSVATGAADGPAALQHLPPPPPACSRIVRLFDVYEDAQHVYLVLEAVPGGDLASFVRSKCVRTFSEAQARRIMSQLLEALEFLHGCGVLHADVKPSNILVADVPLRDTAAAAAGTSIFGVALSSFVDSIKICDFGAARRSRDPRYYRVTGDVGLVPWSAVTGTYGYLAPEILARRGYGTPVDVFSAGVIMYELLAGFAPFRPHAQCLTVAASFPEQVWGGISTEARSLCRSMLDRNPARRPSASAARAHDWFARA